MNTDEQFNNAAPLQVHKVDIHQLLFSQLMQRQTSIRLRLKWRVNRPTSLPRHLTRIPDRTVNFRPRRQKLDKKKKEKKEKERRR